MKPEGMKATVCPTSSIANAFIVQAVTAACVEEMLACKEEPPVFISLNIDGNEDVNEAYFEKYTRLY